MYVYLFIISPYNSFILQCSIERLVFNYRAAMYIRYRHQSFDTGIPIHMLWTQHFNYLLLIKLVHRLSFARILTNAYTILLLQ